MAALLNASGNASDGATLVAVDRETLSRLFKVFLSVHLHSGDIEPPAKQWLPLHHNTTVGFDGTPSSPAAEVNGTSWTTGVPEFGAPVPPEPAAPLEDVTLLLSVILTTACVFLCFLVLLAVKCCADVCCIDLLYCIAHCGRRPGAPRPLAVSEDRVVVRLSPKRSSLERLLQPSEGATKARQQEKAFMHSV